MKNNNINNELEKYKLLVEYNFYRTPKEIDTIDEADDNEEDTTDDVEASEDAIKQDLDISDNDETISDIPEPEVDVSDEIDTQQIQDDDNDEEVEIDVTSIVKGSEEAKRSAQKATKNTEILLKKLTDLERRISNMDSIFNKIDKIEKEIIVRNPTPDEKLNLRSLDSYPFNQKLTDYWEDKTLKDTKEKEYILTKQDVDSDYSDWNIEKSFTTNKNNF